MVLGALRGLRNVKNLPWNFAEKVLNWVFCPWKTLPYDFRNRRKTFLEKSFFNKMNITIGFPIPKLGYIPFFSPMGHFGAELWSFWCRLDERLVSGQLGLALRWISGAVFPSGQVRVRDGNTDRRFSIPNARWKNRRSSAGDQHGKTELPFWFSIWDSTLTLTLTLN